MEKDKKVQLIHMVALVSGLCIALVPASASAQDNSQGLYIDISQCVRMQSSIDRFACYEALANEALSSGTDIQPLPRSNRAPARANPVTLTDDNRITTDEDSFGLPETEEEFEQEEQQFSVVASLREVEPNKWLVTLENGQVWRQMVSRRYRLEEGHNVRIYPSRFGQSYRLAVEELGGFIQVERVR